MPYGGRSCLKLRCSTRSISQGRLRYTTDRLFESCDRTPAPHSTSHIVNTSSRATLEYAMLMQLLFCFSARVHVKTIVPLRGWCCMLPAEHDRGNAQLPGDMPCLVDDTLNSIPVLRTTSPGHQTDKRLLLHPCSSVKQRPAPGLCSWIRRADCVQVPRGTWSKAPLCVPQPVRSLGCT